MKNIWWEISYLNDEVEYNIEVEAKSSRPEDEKSSWNCSILVSKYVLAKSTGALERRTFGFKNFKCY